MAHLGEPIWPDVEYSPEYSSCCRARVTGNESVFFCKECGQELQPYQIFGGLPAVEDEVAWMDEQFANQPAEGIKDCLVSFPVADGSAIYKITSLRPLTMSPVMFMDRWQIPEAHIRGLNKRDLEEHVARGRALTRLFGPKQHDTKPKRRRPREREAS